jgi:ATP-binding cassette subfamily B protein
VSSSIGSNKIIVLDHGEIVETGTHSQLITQKGFYADSYEKQLLTKEEIV